MKHDEVRHPTILELREHIFTGRSVSSPDGSKFVDDQLRAFFFFFFVIVVLSLFSVVEAKYGTISVASAFAAHQEVDLGRGSAVRTGETDETQETDGAPNSGSDGEILKFEELHASIEDRMVGDKVDCEIVSTDLVLDLAINGS
ncbi:hypothetical protein Dimus_011172 [Dionaea muscipula]